MQIVVIVTIVALKNERISEQVWRINAEEEKV